jgi:hypothetical protein
MHFDHLSTYLNDHLAGSIMALELLDNVIAKFAGLEVCKVAKEIRQEVWEDRTELESIMARLGIQQSATRKATAWLGDKIVLAKLHLDGGAVGPLPAGIDRSNLSGD